MSINGLQQQYFANSLDGLTYLDVNGIAINGNDIDIDNLVPYTGANKAVDVGVQPIRTSYIPIVNNDVVNLQTLNQTTTGTVGYVDQYFVPYNGATSDTNLGNKAFTVGTAGNTNLSGLVKTELNNVLAGYNPASIVIGNDFGTITNAGGVYESTSTGPTAYASLFLGSVVVGEKYSISLSLKCVDINNNTNIYIYEASLPNFTAGGLLKLSFNIPVNTTGFTVFSGTFIPTTYTNLVLLFNTQIITGINTLYWNAFSLTGMGSVVKNLIAPTTTLDGANKGYVDTADALRVPYTGATSNVNLGSNNIIATTAQFTGVTNATPSLALGVDGSGNLRSFTVPTAVNLLPLNNVWTGVNYYNDQVSFNANVGAFGGQFLIDGYDLGYTGGSLTASTGASISYSAPYWTCSTVSSRTALITFNVASYIGKSIKVTWSNVAPVTFFVSPYPYFVVSNNGTTVYSSPQPMSGSAVNYTFTFTPTTAITNILITIQGTGTPSIPAVQWTGFAIIKVDTTISNPSFNGNVGFINSVGIGTTTPTKKLAVNQTLGLPSITSAQDFPAQVAIQSGSAWLKMGQYYQAGVGACGVIQSSDYYSSAEHGLNLGLNPLDGKVSIGGERMSGIAVRSPAQAIGRLTINSDYDDSGSGFCINASDNNTTDSYYMNLYPYVVGGGIVGYNFFISNNSNPYNPLSLNRDRVGINNTSPSANFQVYGTGSICGGTNYANAQGYMTTGSLTIGDTTRNYGGGSNWSSNTAGLLMECLDATEIAVHDAGVTVASFMYYSNNVFTIGRNMGFGGGGVTPVNFASRVQITQTNGFIVQIGYNPNGVLYWNNPNGTNTHWGYPSGGGSDNYIRGTQTYIDTPTTISSVLKSTAQPWCRLYGNYGAMPYTPGQTWGSNYRLTVGQSVGMSNVVGNGWEPAGGVFYAPQTGKYQINITFYWNSLAAGSRVGIRHYAGSTIQSFQYCCIEGGGIGGDTVRQYSTMFYMGAGEFFYISLDNGSGTSYFTEYAHSQMSIYMVH